MAQLAKTKMAVFAIFRNQEEISNSIFQLEKFGVDCRTKRIFRRFFTKDQDFSQIKGRQIFNGSITGIVLGILAMMTIGLVINLREQPIVLLQSSSSQQFELYFGLIVSGIAFGAAAGSLVGAGISEPAPKRYREYLNSGGILLSLQTVAGPSYEMINQILNLCGGYDINLQLETATWEIALLERTKKRVWDLD